MFVQAGERDWLPQWEAGSLRSGFAQPEKVELWAGLLARCCSDAYLSLGLHHAQLRAIAQVADASLGALEEIAQIRRFDFMAMMDAAKLLANEFLYALATGFTTAGKIERAKCEPGVLDAFVAAFDQLEAELGNVRELRHSVVHIEERTVGEAHGRSIPPSLIRETNNMFDGQLRDTLSDGSLGTLDVGPGTMGKFAEGVERMLASLTAPN